ncbi:hypothetical protein BU24DRAFT_352838 [Aaosphaeria arxii CBS 175.79]|uniref:Uncharacterized protein n=1 Tax=Aaosphaeria arxii CBS 175.79 TaxID=1450172 RepID=A0A6A5XH96_9PLEO|nr:uncharacterized protein BU24DRAFT_352838 [Aaosphaeria arxii CBS 175.79]KAF2012217.1 hypothetical protein BU24DRAFT_352838 [Aaosphaeria arxii CBS 175.79]
MTWKSSSTSSSKASSLFGLDEDDTSKILVYKYRSGSKALEVSSQHDLCKALDHDPNLEYMRVTKKPIPRGNSRLEVFGEDLMMPEDQKKYAEKPTLKSSLANVGLPSTAYWKRLLFNSFPELYIVSKSISPSNSPNNSPENSQHVSPSTTFPVDNAHPLQDPQAS